MSRKKSRRHKKYVPVWQPPNQVATNDKTGGQPLPSSEVTAKTKAQTGQTGLASHRGARTSLAGRHK